MYLILNDKEYNKLCKKSLDDYSLDELIANFLNRNKAFIDFKESINNYDQKEIKLVYFSDKYDIHMVVKVNEN